MVPWECALKAPWVLGMLQDYSFSIHISFGKFSLSFFLPLINVRNILLSCSLYPSVPLISSLSYSVCIWGCSVLMSLSVTVFKDSQFQKSQGWKGLKKMLVPVSESKSPPGLVEPLVKLAMFLLGFEGGICVLFSSAVWPKQTLHTELGRYCHVPKAHGKMIPDLQLPCSAFCSYLHSIPMLKLHFM